MSIAAVPGASASTRQFSDPSKRVDCESIPDAEKVTYDAFCHCKSVHYTARLPSLTGAAPHNVSVCNCSICTKNGYLLVYPAVPNHKVLEGQEFLKYYSFASKNVKHAFCGNCASSLWIELASKSTVLSREPRVCCNVRMFRGVDLDTLNYTYIDGKSIADPGFNDQYW